MILPLFKKEIKANYKIFIIFIMIISLYAGIIVAMYDPELGKSLEMMAESMPELFAAFSMTNAGSSLIEFVTNYLFGFIMIIIPFVFMLIMISRLICRYIDKGSFAYLLATPRNRSQIILTQLLTVLLGVLLLIVYETVLVIVCGKVMFNELVPIKEFLVLNCGLFGLHCFFSTLVYLTACSFNETKWSMGLGGGLGMIFILIQMLSQVSDKFDFLKYLTPLTLFDTNGLIELDLQAIMFAGVLYLLVFVFIIIAVNIFKKRDLSL